MDCRWRGQHRQHRHCPLAHLRHHPFPGPRRLPGHAGRAHDAVVETPELLHPESRPRRPAQLRPHPEPGRRRQVGLLELFGQGERAGLNKMGTNGFLRWREDCEGFNVEFRTWKGFWDPFSAPQVLGLHRCHEMVCNMSVFMRPNLLSRLSVWQGKSNGSSCQLEGTRATLSIGHTSIHQFDLYV